MRRKARQRASSFIPMACQDRDGAKLVLDKIRNSFPLPHRIFDRATEAKLIALACGPASAGSARWTPSLLEKEVVELNIGKKASDNTGARSKNTFSSRITGGNG
jgi:hypothetical protein